MKVKTKKLEEMSIDNFFDTISENVNEAESEIDDDDDQVKTVKTPKLKKKKLKEKKDIQSKTKKELKAKDGKKKDEEKSLKKSLKKLNKTDPELYKFLEKNDKELLNFTMDSGEPEEEKNEDNNEEVHVPLGTLEVASDESDFEADKGSDDEDTPKMSHGKRCVTLKMLREWQANLQADEVNPETIRNVIKAFNSALLSISSEDPNLTGEFKVEGAAIFNGIIQLCVLHLERAIKNYLKISGKANFKGIQKCKRFSKLRHVLRSYLTDLTKLLENVTSNNILLVILKHLHQIATIFSAFMSITKPVLKRLIHLWSTNEESVRIISFLCILKIARNQPEHLHQVLRTMYMEYVKNSKFVSPNTLAQINFMRRSLTELFLLDLNVAYHHAFLFIRQLAIHLRNAMILQKKEHFQQVYNWQFVNSLKLWGDVLSNIGSSTSTASSAKSADSKSKMHALIYPLVSIINGVIRLKSSAQYFPLRFHCINILINISKATNVYIPVLPYIIEALSSNTFNQQHKKLAMKPLSFLCILRIQKGQLDENAFRDETVEQVYGASLQYLVNECTSIAFPDLIVPFVTSLNGFIKKTRNPKYSQKLKKLVDKIMEQSNYIDGERNKIAFSLNDMNYIKNWEINHRTGKTPLEIFNAEWQKSCKQKTKAQKVDTIEEEIDDYEKLPKIKAKAKKDGSSSKKDDKVVLFPSDDEDDDSINFDSDISDESADDEEEEHANGNGEKMETDESGEDDSESDDEGSIEDKNDIVEDLSIDNW